MRTRNLALIPLLVFVDDNGRSEEEKPVTRLQGRGTPTEAETAPHVDASEEHTITPQTLGADGSLTTVFERRE